LGTRAGEGLFTTRAVKEGDYLCQYEGTIFDRDQWQFLKQQTDIYNNLGDDRVGKYIIGKPGTYGVKINDPLNDSRCNCKVTYLEGQNRFMIEATMDIDPYQEVFMAYGKAYWTHHFMRADYSAITANYGILTNLLPDEWSTATDETRSYSPCSPTPLVVHGSESESSGPPGVVFPTQGYGSEQKGEPQKKSKRKRFKKSP
jgi:hypothetical protein